MAPWGLRHVTGCEEQTSHSQGDTMRVPPRHLRAPIPWEPSRKQLLQWEPSWFKVLLSTFEVQVSAGLAGGGGEQDTPTSGSCIWALPPSPTSGTALDTLNATQDGSAREGLPKVRPSEGGGWGGLEGLGTTSVGLIPQGRLPSLPAFSLWLRGSGGP